uniref:Peptidase S1 domain-containing protein n=1 Tax=Ciona savignyi TaxID=51511 RepID=H2Z0I7_CIOSA
IDYSWHLSCTLKEAINDCRQNECGKTVVPITKIVGGVQASAGEWPWQGLFLKISALGARIPICGATLISQKWVLTAAHCTVGITHTSLQIDFGVLDYAANEASAKAFAVEKIIDHEAYNNINLLNDISLIKLAGVVTYTDYIIPACLPTADISAGELCWITGWGSTEGEISTDARNILREASVPVLNNTQCSSWYSTFNIFSTNLCAGYQAGGVDSCQGDSGGPLVCADNSSKFYLHGITSWGDWLCLEQPGVYTRVSEYQNWISTTQAEN